MSAAILAEQYGASAGAQISLDGMVAYYRGEEAAGADALDAHTGGLTLAALNAPGSAAGKVGNCRTFSGEAGDQAFSSANAAFRLTGSLMLVCWVRLTTKLDHMHLLSRCDGLGLDDGYGLRYDANADRFGFFTASGGVVYPVSAGPVPLLNTWYFVIGWYDAGTGKNYCQVDNGAEGEAAGAAPTVAANPFTWGGLNESFYNVDGAMDEAAVVARVWTPGERAAWFNNNTGRTYPT